MSTRIHGGVLFHAATAAAAMDALEASRPALAERRATVLAAWVAARATRDADRAWRAHPGGTGPSEEAGVDHLGAALAELAARRLAVEATGRRDRDVDTRVEVVVIPSRAGILGFAVVENEAMREPLSAVSTPHPYWDGTDGPDGVGPEEWAERGRLWDEALEPGRGVPARCGPSFLDDGDAAPSSAAVLAAAPGRTARAATVLRDEAVAAALAAAAPETRSAAMRATLAALERFGDGIADPRSTIGREAETLGAALPDVDLGHLDGTGRTPGRGTR